MSLVVLQPCAASISRRHYEDTILSPVALENIAGHVSSSDVDRLQELYPSGQVPLWGAKPGENNQHGGQVGTYAPRGCHPVREAE